MSIEPFSPANIVVVPRESGPLLDPAVEVAERPRDEIDDAIDELFGPDPGGSVGKTTSSSSPAARRSCSGASSSGIRLWRRCSEASSSCSERPSLYAPPTGERGAGGPDAGATPS